MFLQEKQMENIFWDMTWYDKGKWQKVYLFKSVYLVLSRN